MKPIVAATPDQVRENLRALAAKHRFQLPPLSRMSRRTSDYLAKFARGAGGDQLRPSEQEMLAKFLGGDARMFGDREDCEP